MKKFEILRELSKRDRDANAVRKMVLTDLLYTRLPQVIHVCKVQESETIKQSMLVSSPVIDSHVNSALIVNKDR